MTNAKMTMTQEFITPEMAAFLLATNTKNRKISRGTVDAYASDIKAGRWTVGTGTAISIDEDGVLRDGQHRMAAIVQANRGIPMWVCRNVSKDGIYDNNRKRTTVDQVSILRPDLDGVYKSHRYITIAKRIINKGDRRTVSPQEVINFTNKHKKDLDGFFLQMPQSTPAKVGVAVIYLALFTAYMSGVSIKDIKDFYEILKTGMTDNPIGFPVIAYRNYIINNEKPSPITTIDEIIKCQYALKKYLTKSESKSLRYPKDLLWPIPWMEE